MLRKLLIVFASGVILSIIAFGSAWLIGGDTLRQEFHNGDGWNWSIDDDEADHGPHKTRNFAIQPGSQLAMEVPVDLDFTRGDKTEMVVSGPADLVDHLVWENGRLSLDDTVKDHHHRRSIKVRITAPEIGGLALDAPGDVTLAGLAQQSLTLTSRGAIDLDASGKVDRVSVTSEGAGNIDLEKLDTRDATVRVDGVGNVVIGATGTVDVAINGAGNVSLVKKPAVLRSRLSGIGNIDHDY
jgi:hypothetical protein